MDQGDGLGFVVNFFFLQLRAISLLSVCLPYYMSDGTDEHFDHTDGGKYIKADKNIVR